MGDDDILAPGSLPFILEFLAGRDVEILTLQTQNFSSYAEIKSRPGEFSREHIKYFNTPEGFFDYCPGILSVFVFSKNLWQKVGHTGYEAGWSYFEAIYKMLPLSQKKFAYFSDPVIFAKDDSAWVKGGMEMESFIGLKKLWERLPQFGFDAAFMNGKLKDFQKSLPLTLLRAKGHGLNCNLENWRKIYRAFQKHKFYLALAFLIFITPNWVVMAVRDTKHVIVLKDRIRRKLRASQV